MSNWVSIDEYQGESLKATDLKIGESVIGTVTAIDESKKYPNSFFIHFENEGEATRLFTAGNLSYKVKDGKISVGNTYKITRMDDTPSTKKGVKPRTTFSVQVDADTAKKALPAI